jgi:hypothetical protein
LKLRVYDLAHARSGDKGNSVNISVIAYDDLAYRHLVKHLTEERVMGHFAHLSKGMTKRFELPKIKALNFVLSDALSGGVTSNLSVDVHGKSFSSFLLTIEVPPMPVD